MMSCIVMDCGGTTTGMLSGGFDTNGRLHYLGAKPNEGNNLYVFEEQLQ
jgi:hypothetical protein